uniref:TEAD divergent n=1 Tax=Halisarca dujardinii TaxID=2583056 RepID=A0AA50AHU9_HALDU|nr:TEAD divergent [Halisarca dujardinii]
MSQQVDSCHSIEGGIPDDRDGSITSQENVGGSNNGIISGNSVTPGNNAGGSNDDAGNLDDNDGRGDDNDGGGDDNNDAVWSGAVEEAFQQAIQQYPASQHGRRRIVSGEGGKKYGRNELIAKYIKDRTGKARTRKQISSHVQVLSRKTAREQERQCRHLDVQRDAVTASCQVAELQIMSSHTRNVTMVGPQMPQVIRAEPAHRLEMFAPNVSFRPQVSPLHYPRPHRPEMFPPSVRFQPPFPPHYNPRCAPPMPALVQPTPPPFAPATAGPLSPSVPQGGHSSVCSFPAQRQVLAEMPLKLAEVTVFAEGQGAVENDGASWRQLHVIVSITPAISCQNPYLESIPLLQVTGKWQTGRLNHLFDMGPRDRFLLVKVWPDRNSSLLDDPNVSFGVKTCFQSTYYFTSITCHTEVYSFEKLMAQKKEQIGVPQCGVGGYLYHMKQSPLCSFAVEFIRQLRGLPDDGSMQPALEHLEILQVICRTDTNEMLLCLAYVFEEPGPEQHGSSQRIYRLV